MFFGHFTAKIFIVTVKFKIFYFYRIFICINTDSRPIESIHGFLGNADNVSEMKRLVKGNLFYNLFFLCVICLIKNIINNSLFNK